MTNDKDRDINQSRPPGAIRWGVGQLKRCLPLGIKRPIESALHLPGQLRNRLRGKPIVHLLHIRKTGGTAVRHALKGYRKAPQFTIELHTHNVRLQDIPAGENLAFFLRDPVERFVSGFNGRRRQGQPRYYTPWTRAERAAFKRFASPLELARALSSRDLRERKTAEEAMHSIRNVNSSYWDWFGSEREFIARRRDIFFVGFQEHLEEDFTRLRDKLGLPSDVELPRGDTEAHRNPFSLPVELDDLAEENLRRWYASDYAFMRLIQERDSGS